MSKVDPNLKHNKLLFEKRLFFGVPSTLFLVALALTFGAFVSIGWFAAICVFTVIVPPLILVHREDDKGLVILLDKIKRPDFYSSASIDGKSTKVIKQTNDRLAIKNIKNF